MGALLFHLPSCLHFAWTESESSAEQKVKVEICPNNPGFTCSRMHGSAPRGQSLLVPQIDQSLPYHFLPVWITCTKKPITLSANCVQIMFTEKIEMFPFDQMFYI